MATRHLRDHGQPSLLLLLLQLSILQPSVAFSTAADFPSSLASGSNQLTVFPNGSHHGLVTEDICSLIFTSTNCKASRSVKQCGDWYRGQQSRMYYVNPAVHYSYPPQGNWRTQHPMQQVNANSQYAPPHLRTQQRMIQPDVNLSCRNKDGDEVDWFIVIKGSETDNSYLYIDENIPGDILAVDEDGGPAPIRHTMLQQQDDAPTIAEALRAALGEYEDSFYAAYSDQWPTIGRRENPTFGPSGHMKGVVMFKGTRGVWLIHSVPKFPNFGEPYKFADNGKRLGQSFICITFDGPENRITIGHQLAIAEPYFYSTGNIPGFTLQSPNSRIHVQNRKQVLMKVDISCQASLNHNIYNAEKISDIWTPGGKHFRHYARRTESSTDIYTQIAYDIGNSLLVRSYSKGALNISAAEHATRSRLLQSRRVNPQQAEHEVRMHTFRLIMESNDVIIDDEGNKDVASVSFHGYNPQTNSEMQIQLGPNQDHSKWCVANDLWIVCIGDLNRVESRVDVRFPYRINQQAREFHQRGGGMLCFEDEGVWEIFIDAIPYD